jgi:hypothetical protein
MEWLLSWLGLWLCKHHRHSKERTLVPGEVFGVRATIGCCIRCGQMLDWTSPPIKQKKKKKR